ncbi:hypothetical protein ES703_82541 [subsurface metagenome]
MSILKHHPYDRKNYAKIHRDLKAKLQKIAFDNYYQCERCGSHKDLEIHIPNCDPRLKDQPGFYSLLCHRCHKKI